MYNRNIKNLILTLAVLPLLAARSFAGFSGDFSQAGGAVYDGGSDDQVNRMVYDSTNSWVYVVGNSSQGVNNYDWAVIKYDMAGVLLASTTFDGGQTDDYAWDAVLCSNNNLCVVGHAGGGSRMATYDYDLNMVSSSAVAGQATGIGFGQEMNGWDYVWVLTVNSGYLQLLRQGSDLFNNPSGMVNIMSAPGAWGTRPRMAVRSGDTAQLYIETGFGIGPSFPEAVYNFTTYKYSSNAGTFVMLASVPFTPGVGNKSVDVAISGDDVYVVGMSTTGNVGAGAVVRYDSNLNFISSATAGTGDADLGGYGAVAIDTNTADVIVSLNYGTFRFTRELAPLTTDDFSGNGLIIQNSSAVYISGGGNDFVTRRLNMSVGAGGPSTVYVSSADVSPSNFTVGQQAAALKITPYTLSGAVDFTGLQVNINPVGAYTNIASAALYDDSNNNGIWEQQTDELLSSGAVTSASHYFSNPGGIIDTQQVALFIALTPAAPAVGGSVNVAVLSTASFIINGAIAAQNIYPIVSAPKLVLAAGVAPLPVTGLAAVTGAAIGSVRLSWNYQEALTTGATVYIQYSAASTEQWNINNAQIKYIKAVPIAPGPDYRVVPIGAKFDAAGANATPAYYLAVWVHNNSSPSDAASGVSAQPMSALAIANTAVSTGAYITPTANSQNDDYNYASKIARDSAGNIYAINSISTSPHSGTAIHVRKYDPSGSVQWTSVYSNGADSAGGAAAAAGGGGDYGRSVALTPAGQVVAVGTVYGQNTYNDIWIRKYADNGDILWTRTFDYNPCSPYDCSYSDYAYDVRADNNYAYVAGAVAGDVWIGKFDLATGALAAQTRYDGGQYNDSGNAIAIAPDGSLVVAGGVEVYDPASLTNFGRDIWLGKFNSSDLSRVWVSTYVPPLHRMYDTDELNAVKTDSKGNIYAAGYLNTDTGNDIWVAKYDPNGNLMVAKTKNGPANGGDKGFGIDLDNIGNIYVAGKVDTYDQGQNIWVGKYNPNGSLMSERSVNFNHEVGYDIRVSSTGEMFVGAGIDNSYGIVRLPAETGGNVAQTQLSAAPGEQTASVNLTWMFPQSGNFVYHVQVATAAEVAWSTTAAQVHRSTNIVDSGTVQDHLVAALPAYIQFEENSQPVTLPVYYFRVWVGTQPVNATPVASAPQAPAVYWETSDTGNAPGGMEQDAALAFNSAPDGVSGAVARDALGNAYVAYALGTQWKGYALVKVNPLGRVLTASFYNHILGAEYSVKKALVSGGNLYLAGAERITGDAPRAWLVKFSALGVKLWEKSLDAVAGEAADLAPDGSGNIYLTGSVMISGAPRILLAGYDVDGGTVAAPAIYLPGGYARAYGLALALDESRNIYIGGRVTEIGGTANDGALWKYNSSFVKTWEKIYFSSAADSPDMDAVYAVAVSSQGVFAAGSRYQHSPGAGGDNWWLAKVAAADGSEVWTSSYNSKTNGRDSAMGLLLMNGALYAAGYDQTDYNGVNIVAIKYEPATGARAWTKVMDGLWNWDNAMGVSVMPGVNGGLYVGGKFRMWGFEGGRPGYARIYEPVTGLLARNGYKPGSVNISWIADTRLDIGATFYIQYSTVNAGFTLSTSAAQVSFITEVNVFNGVFVSRLVGGLEAGMTPATAGNMDSPAYYFKLGYMLDGGLQTVKDASGSADASTRAVANTPGIQWRTDRYPAGTLDLADRLHGDAELSSGDRRPLARDASGNVYTAGTYAPFGNNSNTAALRKVNASGATVWIRFYADEYATSKPQINGLATDASGNVYAVGRHGAGAVSACAPGGGDIDSATAQDILLLKYSPSGRLLWTRSFDYARGDDNGFGVVLSASNIYIAGEVTASTGTEKAFIAKLDMDGALVSSAAYGASGRDTAFYGLAYDSAGGLLFAAGRKYGDNFDLLVKAYDADLAEKAETMINYGYDDAAFAVAVDTAARAVYVAGRAGDDEETDAYMARLSTACGTVWVKTYNSAGMNKDEGSGVALDGLGGVYFSGTEFRYDINQGKNLFFRKYNTDGDMIWTQMVNTSGGNDDKGGGIAADREGNVYAAVDAAPQGWNADTSNMAGGTAAGANGSGYYKYRQLNLVTVNPRLTVVVRGGVAGSTAALANVPVNFLGFNQTGGIDPNAITSTATNSSGVCYANLPLGRNYFIAVSSHNMVPTIKDQLSDPMGSFFVTLNADTTKQYYLYQRADQANDPVYVFNINITSGLVAGDYVMGEIYINRTSEKVGYSIVKATGIAAQMRIYNVPPADYCTYGIALSIPARNKFQQVFMEDNFPAKSSYTVNMADAMTGTFDVGGSTNPPSFMGMVTDAYGSPLEDVRVIVNRYVCASTATNVPNNCQEVLRRDNLTDVAGKFVFYSLPYGVDLNVNLRKAGYESLGRNFNLPSPPPGTVPPPLYDDFQLAQATYSLTGVLKYNGVPLPNANIMVHGDQQGYGQGNDSYRSCQYGGCGLRSDAQVQTGADGGFTVAGITDGNAQVQASFQGGWRSFNDGNNQNTASDDLRVVVSSQGAVAPNTPSGNPCRAGRVWIVNSSGSCVTAGSIMFNIVPEGANQVGRVYGNITFISTYTVSASQPLVISTSAPLTVMVQQECEGGCRDLKLGFTSVSGSFTTSVATYSVVLSTGFSYWSKILSSEWGRASSINNSIDLRSTSTYRMDITVTKSGGLKGILKMPDGTNFRPSYGNENSTTSYGANIEIRGVNVDGGDGTGLDENGEFEFPNLAPGLYNVRVYPQGRGFIWAPAVMENVSVSVGKTTQIKLQLTSGLAVKPQIYGLPDISTPTWGYHIIAVDSGQEMNQKSITELFFSDTKYGFDYSTSTGWSSKWMEPGQYDFYLLVGAKFEGGKPDGSYRQFANFIGRVKGVAVQKSETSPNIGTAAQPIPINILGSVGQEYMGGTVKGGKIFTDADFERIFANFDAEIQPLIPAVMIYDSAGDLRGFSHAMPDEQAIGAFDLGVMNKDKDIIISTLAAHPLRYFVWGLPPGRYTAVFANPNYPPVAEEITLPGDSTHNFDFEARSIAVGAISGVIKSSSTLLPLEGARVYLKHRTVEKFTLSNSSGAFSFVNLPPGIYRMEIMRDGYVTTGQKTTLAGSLTGDDGRAFQVYMTPSDSVITGTVYLSKFPNPLTKAGVEIVAYDESINTGELPDGAKLDKVSYLPKISVQTDGSGAYEINGVIPGHLYKISAFYSGKLPQTLEVTAEEGTTVAEDITMKDVPPQIAIKVKKSADSDSKLDVIIKSPKELIAIPRCKYNPGRVFTATAAVSLALVPGPGNTFIGQFTMTRSQPYYTIRVTAGDGGNKMEKEFIYNQNSKAKTEQYIQEAAMAGGEVTMDKETEEYSGIELDAGALAFSTTTAAVDFSNLVGGFFSALPSVRTVKTSKGTLTIASAIQDLMASEVYDMNLDNASANKPFTLTLKYDKENPRALTTSGLKIYQFDSATGEWKEVPGNYTIDPMLGVVSVEVASLDSAYDGAGGTNTPLGRKRMKMSSVKNGRYVPNSTTSQNGQFAVFTAKPGTGIDYFGAAFDVYNMPNPFSLKAKTVTSIQGTAAFSGNTTYTTRGTIIKYHLPPGKSGRLKFVIYNLAGEKVRTLDESSRDGGKVYYSEWDGKNDNNTDCASGVYFMLTYVNGNKLGNKPHKLAIIK